MGRAGRKNGNGLFICRAQRSGRDGEPVDVGFFASQQADGGWQLSAITSGGKEMQQGGPKLVAIIRTAVEQAGGVCAFHKMWTHNLKQVFLLDGNLVFHAITEGRRATCTVQEPAATALRAFLQRKPALAGLVQRQPRQGWSKHAAAGLNIPAPQPQPQPVPHTRSGFYVLSPAKCPHASGQTDVPLVCWLGEGGQLQLGGISAGGALLPAAARSSKKEVLGTTAKAWGWRWDDAGCTLTSWAHMTSRAYQTGGEWRLPHPVGGVRAAGDRVQPHAARALSSFVAQHAWAAELAPRPSERSKLAGAVAAPADVGARNASPAAPECSLPGGSSSSASWADPGAERALRRAQERRLAELVAEGAAARATPASSRRPAAAEPPAAAWGAGWPVAAEPVAPAAAAQRSPGSSAGLGAWGWARDSPPPPAAPQPSSRGLPAAPALHAPQDAARLEPWSFRAEAQQLRAEIRALAAENAALAATAAREQALRRRKVGTEARRKHLKARKAGLRERLRARVAQEARVRQALAGDD